MGLVVCPGTAAKIIKSMIIKITIVVLKYDRGKCLELIVSLLNDWQYKSNTVSAIKNNSSVPYNANLTG